MLCPEVRRSPLRSLGLGRGKIAAGWDGLAAIRQSVRHLEVALRTAQYRVSTPLGAPVTSSPDVAEDVDIRRVKLPSQAATVALADLLVDPAVRDGYVRPSTLDDPSKEPFRGRSCNRVPRAAFGEFVRALAAAGMLAAVREPLRSKPHTSSSGSEGGGRTD